MNDGRHVSEFGNRDQTVAGADPGDNDLRDRFAALRTEEAHRTPEFGSLWRRRTRPPRGKGRWVVAAACALIMLVAIVWVRSARHKPEGGAVASITQWNSPTDFLLETPGREFLRAVPEIGGWGGYSAPPSTGTRSSPVQKKFL